MKGISKISTGISLGRAISPSVGMSGVGLQNPDGYFSLVERGMISRVFTFTRSTIKYAIGPDGFLRSVPINTQAVAYASNGRRLGAMLEEQRTNYCLNTKLENNLVTFGRDFDNAAWLKGGVTVTPNVAIAPDGTLTADRVTNNGGGGSQAIYRRILNAGVATGKRYTMVVSAMADTGTTLTLGLYSDVSGWRAMTGEILSGPGSVSAPAASPVIVSGLSTTNWTRVKVTLDAGFDGGAMDWMLYPGGVPVNTNANIIWDARVFEGVYSGETSVPTSWAWPTATGTSVQVDSALGSDGGAVAYSQTATNERPYIHATNITVNASTVYTLSAYIEAISGGLTFNQVLTCVSLPAGATATWRQNGVAKTGTDVVATGRAEYILTIDVTAGVAAPRVGIGCSSNATGTITFSRPQFEQGTIFTSWIPTTSSGSATRGADITTCSNPNSIGFNQNAGTMYSESSISSPCPTGETRLVASMTTGVGIDLIGPTYYTPAGFNALIYTSGNPELAAADYTAAPQLDTKYKVATAWAANDIAMSVDGRACATDNAGNLSGPATKVMVGYWEGFGGIRFLNGCVDTLRYWSWRIANNILQKFSGST